MNLKGMYDMVGYKPTQSDKLDEQKFKKAMDSNKNLCKRNRDKFEENDKCFMDCIRYSPCPICDKCLNKASHLYIKCQTCELPICTHKYNDRKLMIRRSNFKLKVSDTTFNELRKMAIKAGC